MSRRDPGNLACLLVPLLFIAGLAWTGFLVWAIWTLVTWVVSK